MRSPYRMTSTHHFATRARCAAQWKRRNWAERYLETEIEMNMSKTHNARPGKTADLQSFGEYMTDAMQRTVLFWDVMRQRSDQYYEQKAADVVLLGPRDVEELLIEGTESFLRCEVELSVRHPLERLERDSAESFEVLPNIGYGARLGLGHVACPPWPERVAPRLSDAQGPRTIVDHARRNRGRAGGDRP